MGVMGTNHATMSITPSSPHVGGDNHMLLLFRYLLIGIGLSIPFNLQLPRADPLERAPTEHASLFGAAQMVGQIESDRLLECSGMDTSLVHGDLLWAINDGGNGPFLYALGRDGRDLGRVRVAGAKNRDWEGLATFNWQGRPMILIADVGDNDQRHDMHTLYIVSEPKFNGKRLHPSAAIEVAWRIDFSYPDRNHDAEGVAVDTVGEKILVLTKRDQPPLLFALPLKPASTIQHVVARHVAAVDRIPPPSTEDRLHAFWEVRSQPTAMDLSTDGLTMVVLTYKDAYLFNRRPGDSWATAVSVAPVLIQLPLPQDNWHLRQREAICFSKVGRNLFIASEGKGAGIFKLKVR